MKLKELATIQMGYSFRTRLEASEGGGVAVIQMKDLLNSNEVAFDNLVRVDMKSVQEHHYVRRGDLVFRSRGHIPTSAIIKDIPGETVVAGPLLRIRILEPKNILPEYLNWYISQPTSQNYLMSRKEGTHGGMVSKESLEELEISVPNLKAQKTILKIVSLVDKEQSILTSLSKKKGQYISAILTQLSRGE